jgi:hypothetical protein
LISRAIAARSVGARTEQAIAQDPASAGQSGGLQSSSVRQSWASSDYAIFRPKPASHSKEESQASARHNQIPAESDFLDADDASLGEQAILFGPDEGNSTAASVKLDHPAACSSASQPIYRRKLGRGRLSSRGHPAGAAEIELGEHVAADVARATSVMTVATELPASPRPCKLGLFCKISGAA